MIFSGTLWEYFCGKNCWYRLQLVLVWVMGFLDGGGWHFYVGQGWD
jgi:hypothetical protein